MNPTGFAQAVVGATARRTESGFSDARPDLRAPGAVLSGMSDKDRAVHVARSVLSRGDMMLTVGEAQLVAAQLLRALGLSA